MPLPSRSPESPTSRFRRGALLLLVGVLPGSFPAAASAQEDPVPVDSTSAEQTAARDLVDPTPFAEILERVVRVPRVDYARLVEERALLDRYLGEMAAVESGTLETATREQRLAFWVNAYNACMLSLVADHYPLEEAGNLISRTKNFFTGRPKNSVWQIPDVFTRDHCRVAGAERSQDEIEHEIIRPMGDPRIHFAVNCAAVSCPPLRSEPYRAATLDAQLDRATRATLSQERHLRVEDGGRVIRASKVLDWFGSDFGGEEGVLDFLADHLEGEAARVAAADGTELRFFDYDWTLNDIR